eukprot:CAMPEP_0171355964 /NCGR_PEP_ID=MMETSP0878-20121228/45486_1 /TAXON_ID=67004 /ORGANISM="Thalassiosira weissflogii, Strain CCMP1336" /LENGTH=838 /DNA_ID=CAMNT_0011861971 /DNA_START=95 /DNA_END=2608 /DNA_ORIENTATION=-
MSLQKGPHGQVPTNNDSSIVMQGHMMKKKSSPSLLQIITLKWVTRYFILYNDGKLVYFRDNDPKENLVCANVARCKIERVRKSADVSGMVDSVNNSFYITIPESKEGNQKRILVVTNGPDDFKRWVRSFKKLKAKIIGGVDDSVGQRKVTPTEATAADSVMEKVKHAVVGSENEGATSSSLDKNMENHEYNTTLILERASDLDTIQASDAKAAVRGAAVAAMAAVAGDSFKEDDTTGHDSPPDCSHNEEFTQGGEIGNSEESDGISEENSDGERFQKNSILSDKQTLGAVAAHNEQGMASYDNKGAELSVVEGNMDNNPVEIGDATGMNDSESAFKEIISSATLEGILKAPSSGGDGTDDGKTIRFSDTDDVIPINISKTQPSVGDFMQDMSPLKEVAIVAEGTTFAAAAVGTAMAAASSSTSQDHEKAMDLDAGVLFPCGCKGAKIFAFGDSFDQMAASLNADKVLFGLFTTSQEAMMEDETFATAPSSKRSDSIVPFAIEFVGSKVKNFVAENYGRHLRDISEFCRAHSKFETLQLIACKNSQMVKECISQILDELFEVQEDEVEAEVIDETPEPMHDMNVSYKKISLSSSGITAYKNAIENQESTEVPTGAEILACVRKNMGVPYNWVLFQPSQTELIVENAGSGGVVELTRVLQSEYNDQILFGLARVSFIGKTFGSRQIWWALEWTGEHCTSVKMFGQLRDCGNAMHEMIGERSFTVTNLAASDMTLDAICERVKRSCDVTDFDLSVESLINAHVEEQKTIEAYFDKQLEKIRLRRMAEEARKRNEERLQRLRQRNAAREKMQPLLEKRKQCWSEMSLPDILADLGKSTMPGW